MSTPERTATKTPTSLPLVCFYLVLLTIWAVVPARADTSCAESIVNFNSIEPDPSKRIVVPDENGCGPVSIQIVQARNADGEIITVIFERQAPVADSAF